MCKRETLVASHSFRWVSMVLLSGLVFPSKEAAEVVGP